VVALEARVAALRTSLRDRLAALKASPKRAPAEPKQLPAPRKPKQPSEVQTPTGAVGVPVGLRATRMDPIARIYHGHVSAMIARLAPRLAAEGQPLHAVVVVPSWKKTVSGAYSPSTRKVRLNEDSVHPHMTLAHELAHHLDYTAHSTDIDARGKIPGTETPGATPHLQRLMRRLANTPEVQRLRHVTVHQVDPNNGKPMNAALVNHAHYALEPAELFARAFAQWVAERGGSAITRLELNQMLTPGSGYSHLQWQPDHFRPIAEELDRVAREHWGAT
jgi:hypothetical protein